MSRLVSLLLAVSLAGCGGNYATRSATPAPMGASAGVPAGLFISISVELSATAANIFNGLMIAGLLVAANSPIGEPPQMLEDRTINEQDCTRPIVDLTANLKCK
jgi:hypothetical protein